MRVICIGPQFKSSVSAFIQIYNVGLNSCVFVSYEKSVFLKSLKGTYVCIMQNRVRWWDISELRNCVTESCGEDRVQWFECRCSYVIRMLPTAPLLGVPREGLYSDRCLSVKRSAIPRMTIHRVHY